MHHDISPLPQPTELPYVPSGWHPLAWWTLASLCGLGFGLLATCFIIILVLQHLTIGTLLLAILLGGAVVGAVQLAFLNTPRAIVSPPKWVVASSIGCSVAIGVVFLVTGIEERVHVRFATPINTVAMYLVGPISGFTLGMSQWLVVRRSLQQAAWWLLATMMSSGIVWATLLLLIGSVFGGNGD